MFPNETAIEAIRFAAILASSVSSAEAPPPPPAPPVVIEAADYGLSPGGLEVGPADPVVVAEDSDDWDCRTMGNRTCGTTGPNGEDWYYTYDEEGRTIIDEGPLPLPDTASGEQLEAQPVAEIELPEGWVSTDQLEREIARCYVSDPAARHGIGVNSASIDDVMSRDDVIGCEFHG